MFLAISPARPVVKKPMNKETCCTCRSSSFPAESWCLGFQGLLNSFPAFTSHLYPFCECNTLCFFLCLLKEFQRLGKSAVTFNQLCNVGFGGSTTCHALFVSVCCWYVCSKMKCLACPLLRLLRWSWEIFRQRYTWRWWWLLCDC